MLRFDGMHQIAMPKHAIAGFHIGNRAFGFQQEAVPLLENTQGTLGLCAAKIVFGHIVLQGAQQDIRHAVGHRHQFQGAAVRALRRQRSPTLEGAENRGIGGRWDFAHFGAAVTVERVVFAPVAVEHVAVNVAEIFIQPAFDGAAVHMGRQAQRFGTRRAAAHAVGIRDDVVGIEMLFAAGFGFP